MTYTFDESVEEVACVSEADLLPTDIVLSPVKVVIPKFVVIRKRQTNSSPEVNLPNESALPVGGGLASHPSNPGALVERLASPMATPFARPSSSTARTRKPAKKRSLDMLTNGGDDEDDMPSVELKSRSRPKPVHIVVGGCGVVKQVELCTLINACLDALGATNQFKWLKGTTYLYEPTSERICGPLGVFERVKADMNIDVIEALKNEPHVMFDSVTKLNIFVNSSTSKSAAIVATVLSDDEDDEAVDLTAHAIE